MQKIARENNFAETTFAVKEENAYRLRWFTPVAEIDLCGHGTLGAAFIISNFYEKDCKEILFHTASGDLQVKRNEDEYEIDFPAYDYKEIPVTEEMSLALSVKPREAYLFRDLVLVLDSAEQVAALKPDKERLKALEGLCVCVTARGTDYDCVSRVFTPELDISEDPVTGSTHCMLAPFWSKRLNKDTITAYQASERTGVLKCRVAGDRVLISGKVVLFSVAELMV